MRSIMTAIAFVTLTAGTALAAESGSNPATQKNAPALKAKATTTTTTAKPGLKNFEDLAQIHEKAQLP